MVAHIAYFHSCSCGYCLYWLVINAIRTSTGRTRPWIQMMDSMAPVLEETDNGFTGSAAAAATCFSSAVAACILLLYLNLSGILLVVSIVPSNFLLKVVVPLLACCCTGTKLC